MSPRRTLRLRMLTAVVVALSIAGCSSNETANSGTADAAPQDSTGETATGPTECGTSEWVASWGAAPTDADFGSDAAFGTLPASFDDRTIRNVIAPHLGSDGDVRLTLTNRHNTEPVTFGAVTIGASQSAAGVSDPTPVLFGGAASVTADPGEDIVSDPVSLSFDAFEPLAISLYLPPGTGPVTKHWNSNATTFLSAAGSGDQTTATEGSAFTQSAQSWLGIAALDVQAGPESRAVVTLGDSITDGWVGASATDTVLDVTVADQNLRYPDFLQRRFDVAGMPISVINAGISGNQILAGGSLTGLPAVERFASDVPTVAGVEGVIIFEGINDLGLSKAPAADIIAGLEELIAQARAADLKVWIATITPASDSVVDGVASAPNSESDRQVVNEWIRTEADVDGVFDFDEAVRDATDPTVLDRQLGSIDRLHLSPAGYEAIASAVDIEAISSATC